MLILVRYIIGSCANEVDDMPAFTDIKNWTWANYEQRVHDSLITFGTAIYKTAMQLYPPNFKTPEFQFTSMASDTRVNCPTDILAMYAASTFSSPVFRYIVTSVPSQPIDVEGDSFASSYSFHTWDVVAYFGFVSDYIKSPTIEDKQWQENVRSEVSSFVIHGRPNSTTWHGYPSVVANLSSTTITQKAYNPTQCEFWLHNGFFSYAWIN